MALTTNEDFFYFPTDPRFAGQLGLLLILRIDKNRGKHVLF
jgi:hypothetical protein